MCPHGHVYPALIRDYRAFERPQKETEDKGASCQTSILFYGFALCVSESRAGKNNDMDPQMKVRKRLGNIIKQVLRVWKYQDGFQLNDLKGGSVHR